MSVLINHCWCSDSNWGGHYNCRVIVGIKRYDKLEDVYKNKYTVDWANLIERHDMMGPFQLGDSRTTYRLKPEVMEWLNENIRDRRVSKNYPEIPKGWAVGTDQYNSNDAGSFTIFFESAREAFKFIKRWSTFKKPVDCLNYFQDIRRKLNFETGTLQRAPR